jgi:molybdenum cofactor cytidylyltransferase
MTPGIVILAAGESSRMGEPKQLLDYRGRTLLRHAIDTALAIPDAPVVVVLGAHAAQIRARIRDPRILVAENPDWRDGMGGSLRVGLSALLAAHPETAAAIFLLCDQPLLSSGMLRDLVAAHERTGCAIVASEYSEALGVPALFTREIFPELLALRGAGGARQLIRANPDKVASVPFPDGSVDLDTPADYRSLLAHSTPASV